MPGPFGRRRRTAQGGVAEKASEEITPLDVLFLAVEEAMRHTGVNEAVKRGGNNNFSAGYRVMFPRTSVRTSVLVYFADDRARQDFSARQATFVRRTASVLVGAFGQTRVTSRSFNDVYSGFEISL